MQTRAKLHPDAMWDRHYAFEWMGVPPDIAAMQRLHTAMNTTPPWDSGAAYRRQWPTQAKRYAKY